ncbi:MAG: hypothetical protein D6736_05660 [Nitrospinota bacterium]|nr:MAG: hypothetical protein D6736_05660 [Nitrospinota bacterium]
MSIDDSLARLASLIRACAIVASYTVHVERKTQEIAFLSGRIDFRDGSLLDFKEFIEETESGIEKYKYAYNYRKGAELLFRYDNAPDPRAKGLSSFPHHKHLRSGELGESEEKTLSEVLEEIERMQVY